MRRLLHPGAGTVTSRDLTGMSEGGASVWLAARLGRLACSPASSLRLLPHTFLLVHPCLPALPSPLVCLHASSLSPYFCCDLLVPASCTDPSSVPALCSQAFCWAAAVCEGGLSTLWHFPNTLTFFLQKGSTQLTSGCFLTVLPIPCLSVALSWH